VSDLASVLADHRHGQAFMKDFLARNPQHPTEERIVDDRLFLLGLDELSRTGIKPHERTELLVAAREIASTLGLAPADMPLEGYYSQDDQLREYFKLMRTLQKVDASARPRVASLRDFQRLSQVVASPLFGEAGFGGMLFPVARDALTRAVDSVGKWSVAELIEMARRIVAESDDYSLVGLACLTRDPVLVTALRETLVVYAAAATMGVGVLPVYTWRVSPEVETRAARFVATFNALFAEEIPEPTAENADYFGAAAFKVGDIVGRCVRVGQSQSPVKYYHWAIFSGADKLLGVHEFWHDELWTTERYRKALPENRVGPAAVV
jgi:hypothetical protein